MASTLAQGERIEIRGFGSFSLHYRAPRTGRNPKTGDKVELEGKYVPHFKHGKNCAIAPIFTVKFLLKLEREKSTCRVLFHFSNQELEAASQSFEQFSPFR